MKVSRWIALCLIVGCVAALVLSTRQTVQYAVDADEGYYLTYAAYVASHGLTSYPQLVALFLKHADVARYFPHPLRVTAVVTDAMAVRLWGVHFHNLQLVSLAAFLALLIVMYFEVTRAFGERTALWATLLLAASPLHLAMARRALADNLVATLLVASLWLCLRAVTAPRHTARRWWGAVACLYLVTFLAKEGAIILIPCSWLFIGWHAARHRQRMTLWPWCAVSIVPLAGAAAVMALAAGGVAPAWQVISASIASPLTNAYTVRYGSGPWFRYVIDFLLLSPWTTLLYVAWLGYLAAARKDAAEIVVAWALVPVAFLVGGAWMTKNVRYLLALEAPMRLGAVLLLQRLLRDRDSHLWATLRMTVVLGCLMGADCFTFQQLFVEQRIYDPISLYLLQQRHIIPP